MKKLAYVLITLALAAGVVLIWWLGRPPEPPPAPAEPAAPAWHQEEVIGQSVQDRAIEAYTFGEGSTRLLLVGGVHGGYEWNSVYLAYKFIDYLTASPEVVPENLAVTIIPSLNPDGLYRVIGKEGRFEIADAPPVPATVPGRFNANNVDLNRNFDCQWQATSTWRGEPVSAGTAAFSEPEAAALRDWVLANRPVVVIFWHSQAGAVYPGGCEIGPTAENLALLQAYSEASGYPAQSDFTAYEITGDSEGWLSTIGIPALTVELKTHETIEWEENRRGVEALFNYYQAKK